MEKKFWFCEKLNQNGKHYSTLNSILFLYYYFVFAFRQMLKNSYRLNIFILTHFFNSIFFSFTGNSKMSDKGVHIDINSCDLKGKIRFC